MARGRFKLHDPDTTHILTLRISDDLYNELKTEVQCARSTIQAVASEILKEGVDDRLNHRVRKMRAEKERLAELHAAELVGVE